MRRPLTRFAAGVVGGLLAALTVAPMTVALAKTAENVTNADEAWFLRNREPLAEAPGGDPTCSTPLGCNASGQAQRPNEQPEGVLVVASNAGEPDAQTFFTFDLFDLPFGTLVTGGTVTLPVARDDDARNFRPEEANMVACLTTGFVPSGVDAGAYGNRPEFDKDVCTEVKQSSDDPLVFTVDLEVFGEKWADETSPTPNNGITLLQDPKITSPNPEETWRVVFNSTRRNGPQGSDPEDFPKITSTIEYRVPKPPEIETPPVDNDPPPPPLSEPVDGSGGEPEFQGGDGDGGFGGGGDFGGGSGDPGSFGGATAPSGGFDTGTTTTGPFDSGATGSFDSGTTASVEGVTPPPLNAPVAADPGTTGTIAPPASTPQIAPPPAVDSSATTTTTPAQPPAGDAPQAAPPAAALPTTVPVGTQGPRTNPAWWLLPVLGVALAGALGWSLTQPVELANTREGAVTKLMRNRRPSAVRPA